MSEIVEGTWGRTRRYGVIVGIAVLLGALAGCSSGDEDSAYDNGGDAPAAAPADAGGGAAADEAAPSAAQRAVITTGELYVTVKDPMAAADEATDIVAQAGGRIDARNVIAPSEYDGGSASLTLRVPSARLDAVVDDLGELGEVDHFSTQSQDVTVAVADLEAKISTLRASTDRIQGLLADAKGISDIITLEDELASRQAELESLVAQQRGLDDQVSLSTIDLSLTTEPVVIEKKSDAPDSFWDGLKAGWSGLVAFLSVASVVIGALLPWLTVIGIILAAVMVPMRLRRARAARRASATVPPQQQPQQPASTLVPPQ